MNFPPPPHFFIELKKNTINNKCNVYKYIKMNEFDMHRSIPKMMHKFY